MPFDPDDARLTAYALGELDPADRASVEAVLRDDPEAESFVAGVREVVALLADELRLESMVGLELDPERRRAIEDRLAASVPQTKTLEFKQAPPRSTSRFRPHWLPVAAAAGLIGFAAGMFATFPRFATDQQRPSLAFNEAAGRPMMGAEPTARRDGFAAPPQGSEAPSGPAYASAPLPPPPAADVSTPPPAGSKFVRSAPAPAPAAPAKPADAAPLRVFARGGLSSRGSAPLGVEAAAGRNDPPAPAAMANNAPSGRGPRIGSSQQAGNNAMQAAAPAGGEAQGPDKLAGVERVGPGSPLSMRGMRMMPSPVAPAPIDPARRSAGNKRSQDGQGPSQRAIRSGRQEVEPGRR